MNSQQRLTSLIASFRMACFLAQEMMGLGEEELAAKFHQMAEDIWRRLPGLEREKLRSVLS